MDASHNGELRETIEAIDRRLGEFTRWSLVRWAVNTALILGLYFK